MKKHLLSLFSPLNLRWTVGLFSSAILLVVASLLVGIADNFPGIAMILAGMILLFFSVLHPWKKVENYAILIGVCVSIVVLIFLGIYILSRLHKTQYLSEDVVMTAIFLFCVPGILAGIIGSIIWSFRGKK
jgi:membrane-bound ClpP family serine protease